MRDSRRSQTRGPKMILMGYDGIVFPFGKGDEGAEEEIRKEPAEERMRT